MPQFLLEVPKAHLKKKEKNSSSLICFCKLFIHIYVILHTFSLAIDILDVIFTGQLSQKTTNCNMLGPQNRHINPESEGRDC